MAEDRFVGRAANVGADMRRLILELVDRGCRVRLTPDGTVHISPPGSSGDDDEVNPFDFIDWRAGLKRDAPPKGPKK